MTFPSTLQAFPRPTPTDRLNSPSHSALHNTVSSALGQVEAVIGVDGANSVVGTLMYNVRSPASNGGGHVQSANKGGTGQTTFTKGDILVAQNASTISKLAVSSVTGNVLQVDPSAAVGIKWGTAGANKLQVNTYSVLASAVGNNVIFSASILGSVLGINNAIRYTGHLQNLSAGTDVAFVVRYGASGGVSSVVAMTIPISSVVGAVGTIEGMIVGNGAVNSQKHYMTINAMKPIANVGAEIGIQGVQGTATGSSSINSEADQTLSITTSFTSGTTLNSIITGMFVVEKII